MTFEQEIQAGKLSIGTKQTTKMVELGKAIEVYIAKDAEQRLIIRIVNLCKKMGVPVTYVESMKTLGKSCGIEVGAAMVAIVNE